MYSLNLNLYLCQIAIIAMICVFISINNSQFINKLLQERIIKIYEKIFMKSKSRLLALSYCFLLAFIVLSIYGYTTSPFYDEPGSFDSALFQIVGKGWLEGKLPYVDLWDMKGPLLFFINYLGYLLFGARVGVFVIELFALTVTLYILWKLLRQGFSCKYSYILVLLPAFSFAANNVGGNNAAEYLLPLLALSFYLLYKWIDKVEKKHINYHPAKYAFLYGSVLSFSLMTRLTNAVGVCAIVGVIAIWLLKEKNYKNLFQNIFCFLLGFAILFIPFAAYFAYHNALGEMWYGTFLYSLDYASASGSDLHSLSGIVRVLVHFADTWLLLIVAISIFIWNPHRRFAALMWFFASTFSLIWFLRGNGFSHYGLISLPCICISFLELKNLYKEKNAPIYFYYGIILSTIYGIATIASCLYSYKMFTTMYIDNKTLANYRVFLKNIPADYRQSFIAYNCNPDLYQYEHITPYYRFFAVQDFESSSSKSLKLKIRETFSGDVKWILVQGDAIEISNILKERYTIYKEDYSLKLRLYKIKDHSQ